MSNSKPTNPKDMVASSTKVPLQMWPTVATALGCISLLHGALKYGRNNWRHDGARASVYVGAAQRHIADWYEGNDYDEDGVDNIGAALASLAIIADSRAAGKMVDDRNYPGGYRDTIATCAPKVQELSTLHKDKTPIHYTIQNIKQS